MPYVGPTVDTTQHSAHNSAQQLKQTCDLPTGMMLINNLYPYSYE
jgi:hypothetical protein